MTPTMATEPGMLDRFPRGDAPGRQTHPVHPHVNPGPIEAALAGQDSPSGGSADQLAASRCYLTENDERHPRWDAVWRRQADSNRRSGFCRPVPYRLAMAPRVCRWSRALDILTRLRTCPVPLGQNEQSVAGYERQGVTRSNGSNSTSLPTANSRSRSSLPSRRLTPAPHLLDFTTPRPA